MTQRLLHLIDISDDWKQKIAELVPNVEFMRGHRDHPEFAEQLRKAEIVLGSVKVRERSEAPNLKWIQLPHAGADGWQETPEGILISTGAGVYGVPIAEHLFALILGLTRGINSSVRAMPEGQWKHAANHLELCDSTALVVGFGDIGQQFAKRAHAFGMRNIAVKRTLTQPPDYVERVVTIEHLDDVLPEADHVVISLPGTAQTKHLFNAQRLALMRKTAFIYNVGRGSVIDEPALVAALAKGQIAGAGLDVFEKEPLPADSPLWKMPNAIITPHRSGSSPKRDERVLALFVENLGRFASGKKLKSQFRAQWGY